MWVKTLVESSFTVFSDWTNSTDLICSLLLFSVYLFLLLYWHHSHHRCSERKKERKKENYTEGRKKEIHCTLHFGSNKWLAGLGSPCGIMAYVLDCDIVIVLGKRHGALVQKEMKTIISMIWTQFLFMLAASNLIYENIL